MKRLALVLKVIDQIDPTNGSFEVVWNLNKVLCHRNLLFVDVEKYLVSSKSANIIHEVYILAMSCP